MKKKNITILALHLNYGGVEKYISSLCKMLENDYNIKIIVTYNNNYKTAFEFSENIEIEYLIDRMPNKKEIFEAIKNKKIFKCSGGEQQRVALARALVNNPSMLIADEPTGNLDPETAWDIMALLEDINKRGTTVVVATHARDIVDKMKKRVIQIEEGNIIRDDKRGGYSSEI